jgi:hypothetical protein
MEREETKNAKRGRNMVFFSFRSLRLFCGAIIEEENLNDLWRSYDRLQQGRGS